MKDKLAEARLAVCENCDHCEGVGCDLLAAWMSVESVAAVTRNKCPDGRWGPGGWLRQDPVNIAKDRALCRWTSEPRWDRGFVIGSDAAQQWLLPIILAQLRTWSDAKIAIADFGLTPAAAQWSRRHADAVIPLHDPWSQDELRDPAHCLNPAFFKKPLAILAAPFEKIVWIDNDVLISGDVSPLWDYCDGLSASVDLRGWKESAWGPRPPDGRMLQAGLVCTRHGHDLPQQWARYTVDHAANDEHLKCDLSALTKMMAASKAIRTMREIPKWLHGADCDWDGPTRIRHITGHDKGELARVAGIPRFALFTGVGPGPIMRDIARQMRAAGMAAMPFNRPDKMPPADHVLIWNGMIKQYLPAIEAAKAIGATVWFGEQGWLPQKTMCQWDTGGVNADVSWSRAPLGTTEGRPLVPAGRDVLAIVQVSHDTQIRSLSPNFASVGNFIKHICDHSPVPVRVRAHPKQPAKDDVTDIVEQHINARWDRMPLKQSLDAALCVATINSTVGLEAMERHAPVLCYGDALYNHAGACYPMTGDPLLTLQIIKQLSQGVCRLTGEAQDEMVARVKGRQMPRDGVGEWFARQLGFDAWGQ